MKAIGKNLFIVVLSLMMYCCNSSQNSKKENITNDVKSQIIDSTTTKSNTNDKNTTNKFEGEWSWKKNSDTKSFSITIKKKGKYLVGTYCCIAQSGQKMDCGDQTSFKTDYPKGNEIETEFTSYYSGEKGKIKLTLEGKKLIWEIIVEPKGEYYSPKKAIMLRQKE